MGLLKMIRKRGKCHRDMIFCVPQSVRGAAKFIHLHRRHLRILRQQKAFPKLGANLSVIELHFVPLKPTTLRTLQQTAYMPLRA